jgi:hypothetical protein
MEAQDAYFAYRYGFKGRCSTDKTMQQKAAELGERIRQETGVENAVRAFNEILK